jgi:hypothetical protein
MEIPLRKPTHIVRRPVLPNQQNALISQRFGTYFNLELLVRGFALSMARGYQPSRWRCYSLTNGGLCLAINGSQSYRVTYDNGWQGELTPDALSIVCGLLAYNSLTFSSNLAYAENCDRCYLLLREYAMEHREAACILEATR